MNNRLAHDIRAAVDEAEHLLDSAVEAGDERLDRIRESLRSQLRELRWRVDDLEDAAAYRARMALRATRRAVHEHPYRAIGVGAAIGLVAGWLAARR